MAADKKPVWVDEDAHALLKTWAKIQKRPMVEVASALVLEHLPSLDSSAGLQAGKEAAPPAPAKVKEAAPKPAPAKKAKAPKAAPAKAAAKAAKLVEEETLIADGLDDEAIASAPRELATADAPAEAEVTSVDRPSRDVRPIRDSHSKDKRYLGGIWLV